MFFTIWKQLIHGKTPMRAFMNFALSQYTLEQGTVLDLGGGKNPSYFNFLQGVGGATIINIDQQHGTQWRKDINFEHDALPFDDGSIDQILVLNVLEHIYHYRHFLAEIHRVLGSGKTVIGFVPFLITYHADPHDYFRYTHEALSALGAEAGFADVAITPLGLGPFTVNLNTLAAFLPGWCVACMWLLSYTLDRILLRAKSSMANRFPLGYLFILKK